LLEPWEKRYRVFGIDIDPNCSPGRAILVDFLQLKTVRGLGVPSKSDLVICNPPFNGYKGKLACEV